MQRKSWLQKTLDKWNKIRQYYFDFDNNDFHNLQIVLKNALNQKTKISIHHYQSLFETERGARRESWINECGVWILLVLLKTSHFIPLNRVITPMEHCKVTRQLHFLNRKRTITYMVKDWKRITLRECLKIRKVTAQIDYRLYSFVFR